MSLLWEELVQETMPDHLSAEQIALYRGRRIPPEELRHVDDHISQCAECRERLVSASELRAALQGAASLPLFGHARDVRAPLEAASRGTHFQGKNAAHLPTAPEGEHLSYEQLEAYVDGKMSDTDREIARAHLEFCPSCSDDFRDLNTFKLELADSKGQEGSWGAFIALWFSRRRLALTLTMAAVIVIAVGVQRKLAPPHGLPPVGTTSSDSTGKETLSAINPLPPDERSAVLEAISQQKIKSSDVLADLRGTQQTLLGGSAEGARFDLLEPLGEAVLDVRPVFRWQPLAGATSYSVAIFDRNLKPVQSSPSLRATQWTAARPLKRGQIYLWQVTAKLGDAKSVNSPSPPSPEAKFRVLNREKTDELTQFKAIHPEAHLALGILYARAGLLQLGENEFKQIPESHPDYRLAQNLLKSIQQIRHPQG
jgi:Putative zinc-finger